MTLRPPALSLRWIAPLAAIIALASAPPARAKPPTLTGLFPAGAARGQSLSVAMSGTFDNWPVDCRVEGEGLSVKPGEEKGTLLVEVADDARPGLRWIGLHDKEGATSLRPFVVGSLPELVEVEPNDDPRQPQTIDEPRVVVNGRLAKAGDVDGFAVTLESGQTLAADLEANRHIGSPMDGVLQVVSPEGFVLEQNDDAVGRDPRILFQAPAAGTYIVRLFAFPAQPDSSIRFSGSDAYIYRLTLTTGGFIEHAFPLAVAPESSAEIRAVGPNIPEADAVLSVPADDDAIGPLVLTHPSLAGGAEVRRVDGPATVEVEPNDPDNAPELPDRGWVSGRIDPPGDRDAYRISLKKGDKRFIQAESRSLGLPLDAVLKILGPDGKTLAENDDAGRGSRDPALTFTAPDDGEYRVVVADLYGRGSPNHAYLLGISVPEPDFAASLATDVFNLTPGTETKVTVAINRKNEFAGEIEVTADNLPEGVSATKVVSKTGDDSAKSVTIELRAEGSSAASAPFRVVARPVDGETPEQTVPAKIAGFEDVETNRPWLAVLPKPE